KFDGPLSEMHQDLVDRHPVQPCGERRITAKAADLAIKLDENILRQIFGLGRVLQHPQADRVNAAMMPPVDLLESGHIAVRSHSRQFEVRRTAYVADSRRLGKLYVVGLYPLVTMKNRK